MKTFREVYRLMAEIKETVVAHKATASPDDAPKFEEVYSLLEKIDKSLDDAVENVEDDILELKEFRLNSRT